MTRRCRHCRTDPRPGPCPLCDCIGGIPAELLAAFPEILRDGTR